MSADLVVRYRDVAEFHDVPPGAGATPCSRRISSGSEFLSRAEAASLGLRPCERCFSEVVVVRRRTEAEIVAGRDRLIAAGLTADAAELVARHPGWGPVVLAPGVIVSLHPVRTREPEQAGAVA